ANAGKAFFSRPIEGKVVMLNLLRFKEVADYSEFPALAPGAAISGRVAYERYMQAVTPLLQQAGSEVLFMGQGNTYLIGPPDEQWDVVLLVRHASSQRFLQFASDEAYQKIAGHRTAALADARLLPILEGY
ncbi:MAG: DUF1330 domain-containing protein, partial [Bacteroidota bacterium]